MGPIHPVWAQTNGPLPSSHLQQDAPRPQHVLALHAACITPNRVNRSHWPTKENSQLVGMFWIFSVHGENGLRWHQNGARRFRFLQIQTLPTFWAERIWMLSFCICKCEIIKKTRKFSQCKSVLSKMSERSGLGRNNSSWPHLGPSEAIFPWAEKIPN